MQAAASRTESMETDGDPGGGISASAGDEGVVMVKRELLARCMTCSLCKRLFRNATTISECLHTFCRKCIYKRLRDDDSDNCCPVCATNLGIDPTSKLRADHNLQDVRSKIFPFKLTKVKAPEVVTPTTPPVKRKERSLSSLVVETPRITQSTGRRTKGVVRRTSALRGLGPIISECSKVDSEDGDRKGDILSKSDSLSKVPQTRRQASAHAESSSNLSNKGLENDRHTDKDELWKPLNCLVEAASRTKPLRSSPQSSGMKVEPDTSFEAHAKRARDHLHKSVHQDDRDDSIPTTRRGVKGRKTLGNSRRKKDLRTSNSLAIDDVPRQPERRLPAIWFSLNAASDQNADHPLPELPKRYVRLADDGSLPASIIQKYAAKKLNLQSESEVELLCCGQLVDPNITLYKLLDLWLRSRPKQKLQTTVGSSGKEFTMELEYGRPKAPAS